MSPPIWLVPVVLLLGALTWYYIHKSLEKKNIDMNLSRILMLGMVPSFVFAVTTFYLLIPAFYYLLLADHIGWDTIGDSSDIFWRLSTFVGAAILTISPIEWISLLEDEQVDHRSTIESGLEQEAQEMEVTADKN